MMIRLTAFGAIVTHEDGTEEWIVFSESVNPVYDVVEDRPSNVY